MFTRLSHVSQKPRTMRENTVVSVYHKLRPLYRNGDALKTICNSVFAGLVLAAVGSFAPALAFDGDAAAGKAKAMVCAACHGMDGNSVNPDWPKLAGQHPEYAHKQLMDYKAKARNNALMAGQVAALSEQDMKNLAAHFASLTLKPGTPPADAALAALGEQIYRAGNATSGVPACAACHGPHGKGNPGTPFPAIAGQHAKYAEVTLKAYKTGERANDPARMMRDVASKMTDQEIAAVAAFLQGVQ